MPAIHRAHVFDHRLGAQLGRSSGRPVHAQGLEASREGPEGIKIGQVGEMVGVEMAEKDVVDERGRHLQGDRVADTAVAQIEEESARLWFAVPKLDQHGRAFLQPCWRPRRASQERYPHFVLGQDLRARLVHVAVLDL